MGYASAGGRRGFVLAAEHDGAVLHVGLAHAGAKLDQVLVGVDNAALDDLRGTHVIAALVERHPSPPKQPVLPGLLK